MNPDELEVAPGAKREQLQGSIWQVATPNELRAALEKAFDYRGDVTITRNDGYDDRRLHLRPTHGIDACGFVCPAFPEGSTGEDCHFVCGHSRLGIHGPRYSGRQIVGSVGEEVSREEGCRGEADRDRSRQSR